MSPRSLVLVLGLLSISTAHDCYNTKCAGTTTIDCDESTNICVVDSGTGVPTCSPKEGGGDGVDCLSTHFYCTADADTGVAACTYTTSSCYDKKCHGTGDKAEKYITCDQSSSTCGVDGTGTPTCTPGNIGNGVNCTTTPDLDEHYCQNNLTTGVAECVYPPKHDCYNSKCNGTGTFNTTSIDCDQKDNRCSVVDGSPVCINTTRGGGVDCSKDDEFYCSEDKDGSALCVVPPKHSCYDLKCAGTGDHSTDIIACNQTTNRCVLSDEGEPSCVDTTRGNGVDCFGVEHSDYYCGNGKDSGTAVCHQTPPSTCYNNKCVGTGSQNTTTIDCDQSTNLCQVNDATGAPLCVPLSRGSGVNCTEDADHDEHYCQNNLTTGVALCVYPPKHDCYNSKCYGTGKFNMTSIDCDQKDNRCSVVDGSPVCINTTRGGGVECAHTTSLDFWCKSADNGNAVCVLTPPHSCYSQFCQGSGSKNTSFVGCDGAKNRCSHDADGKPLCIPDAHGLGANCNESTAFYCSSANDDPTNTTCMYPKKYDCFNTRCKGVLIYNDTYIGCSADKGHCRVNSTGFPLCVSSNTTTGQGVKCSGSFSCKYDKKTGVAACHGKSKLLPLWIIMGIIAAVLIVAGIVYVVKRRSASEDRQSLLSPAF